MATLIIYMFVIPLLKIFAVIYTIRMILFIVASWRKYTAFPLKPTYVSFETRDAIVYTLYVFAVYILFKY